MPKYYAFTDAARRMKVNAIPDPTLSNNPATKRAFGEFRFVMIPAQTSNPSRSFGDTALIGDFA